MESSAIILSQCSLLLAFIYHLFHCQTGRTYPHCEHQGFEKLWSGGFERRCGTWFASLRMWCICFFSDISFLCIWSFGFPMETEPLLVEVIQPWERKKKHRTQYCKLIWSCIMNTLCYVSLALKRDQERVRPQTSSTVWPRVTLLLPPQPTQQCLQVLFFTVEISKSTIPSL